VGIASCRLLAYIHKAQFAALTSERAALMACACCCASAAVMVVPPLELLVVEEAGGGAAPPPLVDAPLLLTPRITHMDRSEGCWDCCSRASIRFPTDRAVAELVEEEEEAGALMMVVVSLWRTLPRPTPRPTPRDTAASVRPQMRSTSLLLMPEALMGRSWTVVVAAGAAGMPSACHACGWCGEVEKHAVSLHEASRKGSQQ
jgi:hypothetical protein